MKCFNNNNLYNKLIINALILGAKFFHHYGYSGTQSNRVNRNFVYLFTKIEILLTDMVQN